MSEKRAWDIRPNPRKVARPHADPVLARRVTPSAPRKVHEAPQPLKTRRRRARRRILIALGVVLVILLGASMYALWQPWLRVRTVAASGADAALLPQTAMDALQGTYFHIIPRDSIIFLPKESVRTAILAAYPDIDAVSVGRAGSSAIAVSAIPRVEAFDWCGETRTGTTTAPCYAADTGGFLFKPAASTTVPVYAPLAASSTESIGATVANASGILGVIQFGRATASLGARIVAIQIRGDEADLFTLGGTRITYVIGEESAAASLAAASFPKLDLNGGSLDYIDLRFTGKVYYKAKGE